MSGDVVARPPDGAGAVAGSACSAPAPPALGNAALAAACALPRSRGSCGLAVLASRAPSSVRPPRARAAGALDALTGLPNAARCATTSARSWPPGRPTSGASCSSSTSSASRSTTTPSASPAATPCCAASPAALRRARRPGGTYRLRGGQFALLADGDATLVRHLADDALFEIGEGFMVRCAQGSVTVPDEARDVSEALKLADQRVQARRAELRSQGIDELSIASPTRRPRADRPVTASRPASSLSPSARPSAWSARSSTTSRRAVALRDVGMMAAARRRSCAPRAA